MNKAYLTIDNNCTELPILLDTYGNKFIDTTSLQSLTGCYTFDPAYKNTASCESEICYIGGKRSLLTYRGYEINELAQNYSFTEAAHLLFFGQLPSNQEHQAFLNALDSDIDPSYFDIIKLLPQKAHPMSMLLTLISHMSNLQSHSIHMHKSKSRHKAMHKIMGHLPVFMAMIYHHKKNTKFEQKSLKNGYSKGYLQMLFNDQDISKTAIKAMDKIFTLHADHEQNASTSTVRAVASTGSNTYACLLSGISALWGPLHGGANEECLNMLRVIGEVKNIDQYLYKAADHDDPFRLYGFGHRVYKSYDPRALCLKDLTKTLIIESKQGSKILDIALHLEEKASHHPYFIERKLYPNVDFYSGIIQSAIGLDEDMFTTTFTLGRSIGWLSHIEEFIQKHPHAICRPRQRYLGPMDEHS